MEWYIPGRFSFNYARCWRSGDLRARVSDSVGGWPTPAAFGLSGAFQQLAPVVWRAAAVFSPTSPTQSGTGPRIPSRRVENCSTPNPSGWLTQVSAQRQGANPSASLRAGSGPPPKSGREWATRPAARFSRELPGTSLPRKLSQQISAEGIIAATHHGPDHRHEAWALRDC
jgi:hypothetical protein